MSRTGGWVDIRIKRWESRSISKYIGVELGRIVRAPIERKHRTRSSLKGVGRLYLRCGLLSTTVFFLFVIYFCDYFITGLLNCKASQK